MYSVKTLSSDILAYSKARGFGLSPTQAHALATLNARNVKGEYLSAYYWKQLDRVIRKYEATWSTKDRVCGTFRGN